jgi:hypothetical protein
MDIARFQGLIAIQEVIAREDGVVIELLDGDQLVYVAPCARAEPAAGDWPRSVDCQDDRYSARYYAQAQ